MSTPDATAMHRPYRFAFTWSMLLVVSVLLLGVLASLLWLGYRNEMSDRNAQVITDTLWAKQSIEFQLRRHAETLRGLAQGIERGQVAPADLSAKLRALIGSNHEIERVVWMDDAGRALAAEGNYPSGAVAPAERALAADVLQRRRELYGDVAVSNHPQVLRFAVPILGDRPGALVLTYSLEGLLNELVPWWLARENQVTLANAFGEPLVVHAAASPARGNFTHQTPIDMPGAGMMLMTDSVQDTPRILPHVMSGMVAALTLTLIGSLVLLWRDMRRRAQAEARLSEELAFRQAMEDSLVTGLRARDLTGKVTYVNPGFCKMVGFEPEEMIGHSYPMPFYDPVKIPAIRERFAQMLAGTITSQGHETEFVHRDGHRVHVLIHETPLLDAKGRQTGWMSSILDITERRKVEELNRQQQEKLQASSRLVTMGEVATTLSHELNQPLSAIMSYAAGSLNLVRDEESSLRDALCKIQQQAQRAGQIIRAVHDFVRRRDPRKSLCRIADVFDATLPLIQLQARKWHIRVECAVGDDLPSVEADAMMLEQVLLNLTRNGIESMSSLPSERKLLQLSARRAGEGIEVAVIDHGLGIAEELAQQLFTPFFTTKPEGMGMGLNICRTAIEFHRGHLWYEPTPGGGATFRFTLQ
ncbi:PAS domain S-box protein [Uliginosibacterium sp. sgz301328]|uniref:PAS domain S-box protein n=1 Tax=Uliginosibacterium sp. sgz301328 TaxID=3243764 RepID=UPI00359D5912